MSSRRHGQRSRQNERSKGQTRPFAHQAQKPIAANQQPHPAIGLLVSNSARVHRHDSESDCSRLYEIQKDNQRSDSNRRGALFDPAVADQIVRHHPAMVGEVQHAVSHIQSGPRSHVLHEPARPAHTAHRSANAGQCGADRFVQRGRLSQVSSGVRAHVVHTPANTGASQ